MTSHKTLSNKQPSDTTNVSSWGRSLPTPLRDALARSQLPALDGLRAISVFLVIFYHLGIPNVPGAYGVVSFFVISGFLITWLLLKEKERTGRISLGGFYKRRTLRIFPAFYVFWCFWVAALLATHHPVPWDHAWSAFFYWSNYFNALNGDPNTGFSHTWSLAIEEQFYLIWPLVFLLLIRFPRRMGWVIAAAIAAVWLYRGVLVFWFQVDQGYRYAAFDTRFDALLVGCWLAVALRQGIASSVWRWVTASRVMPWLTVGLLALVTYADVLLPLTPSDYRDAFGLALVPVLVGVLIVQLIAFHDVRGWRWTSHPVVVFLGQISYPLYLYQQVTLHPVRDALSALPFAVAALAAIAMTIAFASASYYVVEKPFLKLKHVDLGQWWRDQLTLVTRLPHFGLRWLKSVGR